MTETPPVRVLSVGMVGSGSTYLFNVAREILLADARYRTLATYSDEWSPAFEGRHHLVIKSHWGIRALGPRAAQGDLLPIVSVRHPGDSVCSDMERFKFPFDFAVKRVALSLRFCGFLRQIPDSLVFRYEEKFTSNPRTAALVAQMFGVRLSGERLATISRNYSAASVRAYAAKLETVPNLMKSPDNGDDAWCPTTHIHRGHIGKLSSGRWRDLPIALRRMIDEACGEEAASFGYDCAP